MAARLLFPCLVLMVLVGPSNGQILADAARRLASRVAVQLGSGQKPAVSVRNISSLPAAEEAEARAAFVQALGSPGTGVAAVRLTLSENLLGYVWAVEIPRGEQTQVVILPVERRRAVSAGGPELQKQMIWEQEEPILDLASLGDQAVLVLSPERVSLHQAGTRQSAPLAPVGAWPRDLRGRLVVQGQEFETFLPGVSCSGKTSPGLEMTCRTGERWWPLHSGSQMLGHAQFAPARNFFEGIVELPGGARKDLKSFFSAATAGGRWTWSGLDGKLYVDGEATAVTAGEVAGIDPACGGHAYFLMVQQRRAEADAIQAYAISDRKPVAVGEALGLSGPVTALWPAPGGEAVIAVSRDPKTGRYAASRVAFSCGH